MNYLNLIKDDQRKNVCIDFDGVIHDDYEGFGDGTVYGPIIEGAADAIKRMSERYTIIVFTAKAKSDRPLVNGKTGKELVSEWLEKHDLLQYIKEITSEKPRALTYIDDKAIRFTDWNSTIRQFKQLYEGK